MRKHVHRLHGVDAIRVAEALDVAGLRRRVAADVDESFRRQERDLGHHVLVHLVPVEKPLRRSDCRPDLQVLEAGLLLERLRDVPLLRLELGLMVDVLSFAAAAGVRVAASGLHTELARRQERVEPGLRPVRGGLVDVRLHAIPRHRVFHVGTPSTWAIPVPSSANSSMSSSVSVPRLTGGIRSV